MRTRFQDNDRCGGRLRRALLFLVAASFWAPPGPSMAATSLAEVRLSADVTVELVGQTLDDEAAVSDDLAGTVAPLNIGLIPSPTDLDAYELTSGGDHLLSFDTTVSLPGGLTARPGDVVRFDGASYSIEFDAAAAGVPQGKDVDAIMIVAGSLVLSFDASVDLNGLHVDDEDLVRFDDPGFAMYLDGSAVGIAAGLDLDAADYIECSDHLLLSFDGSGVIDGVAFDDEDLLEFDPAGNWEMAYDGSARHAGWATADLDAVDAVPDVGPGPPVVFGQSINANLNKVDFLWTNAVAFRVVRGSFVSPSSIGNYAVDEAWAGNGSVVSDTSMPTPGTGYWYLVKPGGCLLSSWQSTLGAEPGRDAAIP